MNLRVISLASGVLFGAGLVLSGMADPKIVLGFLTWGPSWNPALAFVMAGALLVTMPGFALMRRRGKPVLAERFTEPTNRKIDWGLVMGALVFGVGWGLSGLCPGPAVVSAGLLQPVALLFLPAMLAGGWLAGRFS